MPSSVCSTTHTPVSSPPPLLAAAQPTTRSTCGPPQPFPPRRTSGQRVVNAREKTLEYTLKQTSSLTPEEREDMRRMFRDRFEPTGRPVASIQALQSLADQRIEDAVARGQFKNLPRGKPLERDYNASSPFLDTTEYFLNKIIQRQDIVPPWIEKQQEMQRAAAHFRGRLKLDWRRHVARSVAARGGSLDDQCRTADLYAAAERRLARIESRARKLALGQELSPEEASTDPAADEGPKEVFRDPAWEKTERGYHTLAVQELNDLTRSYNLMAPELAKKPYFSLERELRAVFLEVAGEVAAEIRTRARVPRGKELGGKKGGGGVMEKLGVGQEYRVYDEQKPAYGFRELWKDLWGRKGTG